jgi:dimethyladenosine transferase 1
VIALEKDERFVPALKMLQEAAGGAEKMSVVLGDALLVDEAQLLRQAQARTGEVHVVGNLPFAVSTELLLKWVRQVPRGSGLSEFGPVPMTLLFQKEVGERLCAQPGQKEFGRLSVMTQHVCAVRRGFEIRGSAFVPKPDVDSLVITVTPKTRFEPVRQETLELVLRQVCGQRRKMMRNATLSLTPDAAQLLAASELDDTMRPEQLTVAQVLISFCVLCVDLTRARTVVSSGK